jgi:hypothetical protein
MTTGKLAAWGPSFARFAGYGGQARCSTPCSVASHASIASAAAVRDLSAVAHGVSEGGRWVVPDNLDVKEPLNLKMQGFGNLRISNPQILKFLGSQNSAFVQLNILQTVVSTDQTHAAVSACMFLFTRSGAPVVQGNALDKRNIWSSLTAD